MSDAGVSLEPVVTQADREAAEALWAAHGPWKLGTVNVLAQAFAAHRQAAVAAERARIVAWLRDQAAWYDKSDDGWSGYDRIASGLREAAAAIEGTDLESPYHG